jgi:hypothetical protein
MSTLAPDLKSHILGVQVPEWKTFLHLIEFNMSKTGFHFIAKVNMWYDIRPGECHDEIQTDLVSEPDNEQSAKDGSGDTAVRKR